jgi:hypothetical protein
MELVEQEFGFRGDRVRSHTSLGVNRAINKEMQSEVQAHTARNPREIDRRIRRLEREWDIERVLELHAAALGLLGLILGTTKNRKWLFLPGIVLSFLLVHVVEGTYPPLFAFRRFGIRTQREIEAEKYALKALQKERIAREIRNGRSA